MSETNQIMRVVTPPALAPVSWVVVVAVIIIVLTNVCCLDPDLEKGLTFLGQKGVFAENPIIRQARERLLRLFASEAEIHSDILPVGLHEWSDHEFPGYNREDVFFLTRPVALSQRYQRSGLCYLHAPAMVQHYALAHNNHSVPMLDLLKFIKEHFTAKQLEQHIFENEGGDSSAFLKSILQPGSVLVSYGDPIVNFCNCGPGLVSKFEVHEDFMNSNIKHHYGKPSGELVGYHAMTLNWWLKKQFVEVDAAYLKACGATLWFIETPQTQIPGTFSSAYGRYHKLEAVDKPEGHVHEMTAK